MTKDFELNRFPLIPGDDTIWFAYDMEWFNIPEITQSLSTKDSQCSTFGEMFDFSITLMYRAIEVLYRAYDHLTRTGNEKQIEEGLTSLSYNITLVESIRYVAVSPFYTEMIDGKPIFSGLVN